jgi:hypothetical protein
VKDRLHIKQWPLRRETILGENTIAHWPLVDKTKIYLPPIHLKLGLIKISVKAMNKKSEQVIYLRQTFPHISQTKTKEGIFVIPQENIYFKTLTIETNWILPTKQPGKCLKTYTATFWEIKIRKICRNCGAATFLTLCIGVQHVIETPFPAISLGFFPRKCKSHLRRA